jgi:hypothetical protein
MSNCGSSGVMSADPDRTILTLFGPNNKPHVMVVYSPNDKRISGDECAGSSPVKPQYHAYVLDLAHHLGVRFDEERSKSPELRVKYLLKDKAQSIEPLQSSNDQSYDHYFRFTVDGQGFYTDGHVVVSGADVDRVGKMIDDSELVLPYPQQSITRNVFNQYNRNIMIGRGVEFIPIRKFIE